MLVSFNSAFWELPGDEAILSFNASVMVTCTALAIAIAIVQPYRKQFAHFNDLDPLVIFFSICWLVSYEDLH